MNACLYVSTVLNAFVTTRRVIRIVVCCLSTTTLEDSIVNSTDEGVSITTTSRYSVCASRYEGMRILLTSWRGTNVYSNRGSSNSRD